MKIRKCILPVLFLTLILSSCGNSSNSASVKFAKQMGLGYNWGNTMEAWGTGQLETGWGAPVSTKEMFEDLKARGISTIRLPVAWSFRMDENHTIYEPLADRVNEIVDMAIDSGMYVILNIHWDGGWINDKKYGFSKKYNDCMQKYTDIWKQIAERYKDYDEHLVFESLNEEGCFDDVWNRYSGSRGTNAKNAYTILNTINQKFVDIVRESGGNNKSRYLLIAGYATDIDLTIEPDFVMPKDPKKHCMISVHYYTPSTFAILTEDASWGKSAYTWGTAADIKSLEKNLTKMKAFSDKGIGVVIGEYGCPVNNKDPESVRKYLTEVATVSYDLGYCPVLWGGSVDIYSRRNLSFDDPAIGDMYLALSKKARK